MTNIWEQFRLNADGLIPAIVQDDSTGDVLMMAYMNQEAWAKTLETKETWFYSRSRDTLWHKGETSGHIQKVRAIYYDCDADTLLVKVEQTGVACHTGEKSCFHNPVVVEDMRQPVGRSTIMYEIFDIISQREVERPEGSYTTYLFNKGLDKILKKVGEEAAEVIIGAKNRNREEVVYETADLFYHLLVLLKEQGITPNEVFAELSKRR